MSGKMTSEHASDVKITGHTEEGVYAKSVNGKVIDGSKVDVLAGNGDKFQLKRGKRYQFALYSRKETLVGIPYIGDILFNLINKNKKEERDVSGEQETFASVVELLQSFEAKKAVIDYVVYGNIEGLKHRFNFDDEIITTEKEDLLNDLASCDVVVSGGEHRKAIFRKDGRNIIEVERRRDKNAILFVTTAKNLKEKILYKNEKYLIEKVDE